MVCLHSQIRDGAPTGEPAEVVIYCNHLKGDQIGVAGTGEGQVSFRPIKTSAHIAAELRTATIKRAAELCPFPRADSTLVVLEALYDNGILKGDAK